ncbi:hypothetical protein [Streptomyces sp. NPDC048527]
MSDDEYGGGLRDEAFDYVKAGARNPGGPLITKELDSWLIDALPS